SDEAQRTFAAGAGPMIIEVLWRSGHHTVVSNAQPNCIYEVAETAGEPVARPETAPRAPLFRDVSSLLKHKHAQDGFDDFAVQPLLPRRFSQAGPGISFYDVDKDGWDDVLIAAGKGGETAL